MGRALLGPLATLAAALGAVGCGAGTPASSPPRSPAGTTASVTGSGTGTGAVTGTSSGTGTASGTPTAPPARLAVSHGYGTYEHCQGTCHGAVPAALRRPPALPAADGGPCPVTLNAAGPVSETGSTQVGFRRVAGSAWLGADITWSAAASYTGPVLIRGRQIGGGGVIGFGGGQTPYDELQLLQAGAGAPRVSGGGRAWLSDARVTGPGCYAFAVDGTDFSEVLVFRAVG